jgi:hypothetical protein
MITNTPRGTGHFDKAVFTVSLDFELMWGTKDRPYGESFRKLCAIERREVVDRLLTLLAEYDIRATWGVVGNLFLKKDHEDPLLYGSQLIERIRRCPVQQEIASHTMTHTVLEAPGCTVEMAERELGDWVREARANGVDFHTLILPRNRIGHLDVARRVGFRCYRGDDPSWYDSQPRPVRRFGHLLDILTAHTPASVMPVRNAGMWSIPGSMLYTPAFGMRRCVPVWLRVLRANRGLNAALRQKRVFHLWFHPTDLTCRTEAMLEGLRAIFERAAALRDAGQLDILPMRDLIPATMASGEQDNAQVLSNA